MPVINGIELSYDNGATWKMLYATTPDEITALAWGPIRKLTKRVLYWGDAYAPGGSQNIVVRCSRDGGATVYSYYLLPAGYITALATSKLSPATAYFSTSTNKIFKTTDYGINWTELTTGFVAAPSSLSVSPGNPDIVVAGVADTFSGGFYYSVDGGVSWTLFRYATQFLGLGSAVSASGTILGAGAYVSGRWIPAVWNISSGALVFDGAHGTGGYNPFSLVGIDIALVGNSRVIAANYPANNGGLVHSTTRGASFVDRSNASNPVPGYTDDYTRVALSKSGKIAYMTIESVGLHISEDEGVTWEKVYDFVADVDYRVLGAVIADPVEENWVWMLAGEDLATGSPSVNPKGIRFSEDKGETWDTMRNLITPAGYMAFTSQFAMGYDRNTPGGQLGGV